MTVGDSIALVGCLWGGMWFTAWLLKRIWPARFGGDLEHWLLLKREELERKHVALAKARHDDMERHKQRERQHDERWPHRVGDYPPEEPPYVDGAGNPLNHKSNIGRAHVTEDGAFAGGLKERPDFLGHVVADEPKGSDAWNRHKPKGKP